jgi:hypothetical protein
LRCFDEKGGYKSASRMQSNKKLLVPQEFGINEVTLVGKITIATTICTLYPS